MPTPGWAHSWSGKALACNHIAFGVDGIEEVAKGLVAQGHKLSGKDGTVRSAEGYLTATLAPESALGFPFQVAEGQIAGG